MFSRRLFTLLFWYLHSIPTELIEEKRESVKEEVDSLVAQWKHVNVDELLEKDREKLPGQAEDRNRNNETTDAVWEDESEQSTSRLVVNGSSNTNESSGTYSAKEQRIKRKGVYLTV